MRSTEVVSFLLLSLVIFCGALKARYVHQENKTQDELLRQRKPNAPAFILQKYKKFASKGVQFNIRRGMRPSFIRFYPSQGTHRHCQYTFTVDHVTPSEDLLQARLYLLRKTRKHIQNVTVYDTSDRKKILSFNIADKKKRWVAFPLGNSFIKRYNAKLPEKTRIVLEIRFQERLKGRKFFKGKGAWLALFTKTTRKTSQKDWMHPDILLKSSAESFPAPSKEIKITETSVNKKKDMIVSACDLGLDWIIEPRVINLYRCKGQCTPTQRKPLAVLYAKDGGQFIISWIENIMVTTRCGCP